MNEHSVYQFEKRIRELRIENEKLQDYRRVMKSVYDGLISVLKDGEGKGISVSWILVQFKDLLK